MLGVAIAALLASATPSAADRRDLPQAIDAAIDFCSASAFGTQAKLDGRLKIFTYADDPMATILRKRGITTTADAPALIQRFAATALSSRAVGHRDIIAIGADDGIVWLVMTAENQLCDIAITGIDDASTIPSSVSSAITRNNGWNVVKEFSNDTLWASSFELEFQADGSEKRQARINASGLVGGLAKPDGIQAEINFGANQTGPKAVEDN